MHYITQHNTTLNYTALHNAQHMAYYVIPQSYTDMKTVLFPCWCVHFHYDISWICLSTNRDNLQKRLDQYSAILRDNAQSYLASDTRVRLQILLGSLIEQGMHHRDTLDGQCPSFIFLGEGWGGGGGVTRSCSPQNSRQSVSLIYFLGKGIAVARSCRSRFSEAWAVSALKNMQCVLGGFRTRKCLHFHGIFYSVIWTNMKWKFGFIVLS